MLAPSNPLHSVHSTVHNAVVHVKPCGQCIVREGKRRVDLQSLQSVVYNN